MDRNSDLFALSGLNVIASPKLREHDIIKTFPIDANIRFNSSTPADIIFHHGQMSLAIAIVQSENMSPQRARDHIVAIQSSFRHSIAVILGPTTENYWTQLQLTVPMGTCRLHRARELDDAIHIMAQCTAAMFDIPKLDVQKHFFIAESERMVSVNTAQEILIEALSRMDISEVDIGAVYHHCQSLGDVIASRFESLRRNAFDLNDRETVEKMENFFTMESSS